MHNVSSGHSEFVIPNLSAAAREVLGVLKSRGEAHAEDIANDLGITPSAVRQHLSSLRANDLVTYSKIRSGPGRPKFVHRLTERSEDLFPKAYRTFTSELLLHVEKEDPEILARFFNRHQQKRIAAAHIRLANKTLDNKIAELTKMLNEDGYHAQFQKRPDGTYLITENNCTILEIASRSKLPCRMELEFFREVLPETKIDRVTHKLSGHHACGYEVRPQPPNSDAMDTTPGLQPKVSA